MLFRLNEFIGMSSREKEILDDNVALRDEMHCLKWRAHLYYTASRNVGNDIEDADERRKFVEGFIADLKNWLETFGGAMKFAQDMAEENKRSSKCNKRTQIRKFYDEVQRLNALAKSKNNRDESQWNNILPILHMMTAKAAYAQERELVSNSFTEFVKKSVAQVKRPKDLEIFSNFFEAFMGFYRLYEQEANRERRQK